MSGTKKRLFFCIFHTMLFHSPSGMVSDMRFRVQLAPLGILCDNQGEKYEKHTVHQCCPERA